MTLQRTLLTLLALCLAAPVVSAAVPMQIPLQGALRDNAGAPVSSGTFEMTFTLYRDAEGTDEAWTTTRTVTVQGGLFRAMLGEETPVDPQLFGAEGGLWLGVTVEQEPELPLRPLASTPYALAAGEAAGLSCSGCVSAEALSADATAALTDAAVSASMAAVEAAGYDSAQGTSYDGATSSLEATTVQSAIDELKGLLDEATSGGGANSGNVNEGAGQVVAYELDRDVQGGGSLKQYVHLVNPATPKVIAYLYGEQGIETLDYIAQPLKTGDLNFNTHSHGGGYSPYHDEFWYPNWSGSTIYRFSPDGGSKGSFNSGRSDIMQVWGDEDGSYYTANWGYNTVAKWQSLDNANSQVWSYNLGSTAGGICTDGEVVYAMRSSGNTVYVIDKDSGNQIETFNWSTDCTNYGGLVCLPGRLYRANSCGTVEILDTVSRTEIGTFNVCEDANNMSFDGQTMWISSNDSSLCGYDLLTANLYQTEDESSGWELDNITGGWTRKSATQGVTVSVDGVDVTALVGDPNGKGEPHFNAENPSWGVNGVDGWSSGQLDLTNVADWTLGEHTVELTETGGKSGELKGYVYVIYPFTESTPPVNDTCDAPVSLEVADGPVVVSGTTEDTMGKILATDSQNGGEGCSLEGGPDAIYRIDLAERSLINAAITSPFPASLYVRSGDCDSGEVVYCGGKTISTPPLEPGTYYLVIDGDSPGAKGDYALAASLTPALLPEYDTCDTAVELLFSNSGIATHTGSTLYSLDQYSAFCGGEDGPDVVYAFTAGTGEAVNITVTSDEFEPVLHVYKGGCAVPDNLLTCSVTGQVQISAGLGGDYWLVVDAPGEAQWGTYDLTVSKTQ